MDMRWFLIKHPEGTFLFQGKGGLILFNQKAFLFFLSRVQSAAQPNPIQALERFYHHCFINRAALYTCAGTHLISASTNFRAPPGKLAKKRKKTPSGH